MKRSSSARDIPPPLELECLKALWRLGDGTVKDVRGILTERRNLAYTTVMTVLDRLVKRGSIERKKHGRSFVYTPLVGRQELRRLAVAEMVDAFFDGSEQQLRDFLDGRNQSDEETAAPIVVEEEDRLETELL